MHGGGQLTKELQWHVRRLRFDGTLERRFLDQHTAANLVRVRAVFTLFAGLMLVTQLTRPVEPITTVHGRVNLFLYVVMALGLFVAYSPRLRRFAAVTLAATAILTHIVMAFASEVMAPGDSIIINLLYAVVIIAALQARFWLATTFCVAMLGTLGGSFAFRGLEARSYLPALLACAAIFFFLCFSAYLNETRDRRAFLLQESLAEERARTEALVRNVLPPVIAERLSRGETQIAESHGSVSVLFVDIVNFTPFASSSAPETVVGLLNQLFSRFDELIRGFHLEKIKTVGDAYMVAGGVPEEHPDHLVQMANLALELRGAANTAGVDVRIGLHEGPVIAGVLGTERLMYDLWGETVNMASRLESAAGPGFIAVSARVCDQLSESHDFDGPLQVDLKGFGMTEMYHLRRRKIRGLGA